MKWIPQSLRSYDGTPVTDADAARPEVRASLMQRQRNTLTAAVLTVPFTVLMMTATLWPHTDHRGLIVWAFLAMTNTIFHWIIHLRLPLEEVTQWRLFIGHANSGLSWAALPLIAMPNEPAWQAVVGTMMFAVLAAGLIFTSQFAVPFAGWVVSLSSATIVGFLLLDSGVGNALASLAAVAAVFSLLLGAVLRAGDLGASVFAARNADLVGELQIEKQHLRELATTDMLTGIGNRLAFSQDLSEALASATNSVTMALIDLDRFKQINDTLGHHAGDQVLQAIALRIEHALEPQEKLYRLGGDELTVIQQATAGSSTPDELGERLIAVFEDPLVIAGRPLEIKASIGLADAAESRDAEGLQRGADEALYRAKRLPHSAAEYFDAAMRMESVRNAELRTDVAHAISSGHIVPWLQPVVDLKTGAIAAAEALARWDHPDGVRSAASFMPAAEESGMAPTLDAMVFDAVCQYQRRLTKIHRSKFNVAFNISPAFLQLFLERYASTGALEGSVIEITEQSDLTNHKELTRLIKRTQDAGALVVVDDFGMGFSSMERLNLGSFDGLKIDGSFVQSLADHRNSAAIVASITEIGRQLRIPVVAEGIESPHHAAHLVDFGVRWGQGYLYSPAIPVDELADILERQRVNGPHFADLVVGAYTT